MYFTHVNLLKYVYILQLVLQAEIKTCFFYLTENESSIENKAFRGQR